MVITVTDAVSIFNSEAVERLRKETRLDPEHVRALRNALFKKFEADDVALARFPERDRITCHSLELFRRYDSQVDGASKLLLKTAAGMLIESVILRIATGRSTLCVSSQIGCAAACDFCATGKMGIAQNLSSAEILDQVLQTGQLLAAEGRRLHNIVFMGMGEPFHNEDNLFETLDALTSPKLFNRSPGSILVSTVGVPDGMLRCAERFPKVNLALSLHSVNPEVRRELIPLTKKHPLDELHATIRELNRRQGIPVMIEYLMLAGKNDSPGDASQLVDWLHGLNVHVNLIPYNEIEDAPHLTGTEDATIRTFASTLKESGLTTTVRYSLGSDIAAACGQLVRRENRETAIASNWELPGV
jgi:23S rRNA (adenine2503-C2)-methyltransferase